MHEFYLISLHCAHIKHQTQLCCFPEAPNLLLCWKSRKQLRSPHRHFVSFANGTHLSLKASHNVSAALSPNLTVHDKLFSYHICVKPADAAPPHTGSADFSLLHCVQPWFYLAVLFLERLNKSLLQTGSQVKEWRTALNDNLTLHQGQEGDVAAAIQGFAQSCV